MTHLFIHQLSPRMYTGRQAGLMTLSVYLKNLLPFMIMCVRTCVRACVCAHVCASDVANPRDTDRLSISLHVLPLLCRPDSCWSIAQPGTSCKLIPTAQKPNHIGKKNS